MGGGSRWPSPVDVSLLCLSVALDWVPVYRQVGSSLEFWSGAFCGVGVMGWADICAGLFWPSLQFLPMCMPWAGPHLPIKRTHGYNCGDYRISLFVDSLRAGGSN